MSKTVFTAVALLFSAFLFATTTARAADADRALLASFARPPTSTARPASAPGDIRTRPAAAAMSRWTRIATAASFCHRAIRCWS